MTTATEAHKPVVLSVDDEPNICNALKRCLRPLGVKIVTANSGQEGLERLAEEHVDLIISDMRMPGMSGAQFLKEAGVRYPQTRRILLTGYADVESTVMAINEGGISSYVSKPWDDDRLRQVVSESLEWLHLTREKARLEVLTREQNKALQSMNEELEARVEARTRELVENQSMLEHAVEDLYRSHKTMVGLLSSLVALRDQEGVSDLEDKKTLAVAIARELEMDDEAVAAVEQATLLHRIGRMGLPDNLMNRSARMLSGEELKALQKHPIYAEALLMGVPKLNRVAAIIRAQHERLDGRGYPDRKGPADIPLGSRVLAIARDFYDLVAGRLESRKFTPAEALSYISEETAARYGSDVFAAFRTVQPKVTALDTRIAEIAVPARSLSAGMRLSRDLTMPDGLLLLNKNHALTDSMINKIINLEETIGSALSIYILKGES